MKIILGAFGLILVSGCATTGSNGTGFWKTLDAKKTESIFYTAKYVGTQKSCFPPISNRECMPIRQDEVIYEEVKQLNIEEFWFHMGTENFFDQGRIEDMIYLASAEMAVQRGFSLFTVVKAMDISFCRTYGVESKSSGSLNRIGDQAYYSGSTTARPNERCSLSQGIKVIMFNDKSVFSEGVFSRSNSGPQPWRLYPVLSLYFGTIPGLKYEDFNYSRDGGESRMSTPPDAWKMHYEAKGLISDLRAKYKLSNTGPIAFKDELAENLKREANDPLKRNRVISAP